MESRVADKVLILRLQMLLMRNFAIVLLLILPFSLVAQQRLQIKTLNTLGQPISYSSILIKSKKQNTNPVYRTSDSTGSSFTQLYNGAYLIEATAIGYKASQKNISIPFSDSILTIVMSPDSSALQSIVVTARKPLMRQEDDKTIVDPENIQQGTTNAYEVMERIPGLFMDQDGNIYLNSTSPSAIWINGREQRMSAADVATILKSLPPNSIERIELVRTPSARYDASGGGGIVNVILKKNVKIGLTGSVNAGFNQGKYGNQFAGLNLNNSNGKTSTSLNINLSARNSFEDLQTDRVLTKDSIISQFSRTKYPGRSIYTGFVYTYAFHPKWEISSDSRFSLNGSTNNSLTNSGIQSLTGSSIFQFNQTGVENDGQNLNLAQGLNLKHKIDSLGSEWVNDLNYNYAENQNDQAILNQFTRPTPITQNISGIFSNQSHFFSWQSNYLKKFKNKFTLEAGIKTGNLWFNNASNYFFLQNSTATLDRRRSNTYQYAENIHAAYLQGSKTFGKVILKTGLRLENTNMQGRQTFPTDTSFSIHRTDAFPYIYLSRALMSIAGYELRGYLVYRRTISRPGFSQLNPALRIIDPFLYENGNPTLRPQFTQNYEANISVDERPIFAVGINQTKDIFSQVVYQSDTTRAIALRTFDNLGKNKETYFRVIGAIPPGKKYFFVVGLQYNHNLYNGQYENAPLNFSRGSLTMFTYHNLKITKTMQFSLNGFYRWRGQQQFYELDKFGQLNMTLSKLLFKKKLTLSASLSDMFYTNWNQFYLKQGSLTATGYRKADTRRISFTIRYNFGIRKKEDKSMFDLVPNE